MQPLVLATDLDGTFLGGDAEQRQALYEDLRERAAADALLLIFVTGRDLPFVTDLVTAGEVPHPDLIIGDVGTTVVDGRDLSPVAAVERWIDERWCDAAARVRGLLAGTPGIDLQRIQGGRRVSYDLDPDGFPPEAIARVEREGFDVVASDGRFLDVLPPGVAKGPTLLRLLEDRDIDRDRVLVAGDTLNDLSLFHTGLRAVAVGNSEPALLEAVADLAHVWCSPHPGCAGIADAIARFEADPSPRPSSRRGAE